MQILKADIECGWYSNASRIEITATFGILFVLFALWF